MRLNGKMSKKQPALLLGFIIGGLIIFQNCSKVGVEDLSAVDQKVGAQGEFIPVDNGSPDPISTPAETDSSQGSGSASSDPTMSGSNPGSGSGSTSSDTSASVSNPGSGSGSAHDSDDDQEEVIKPVAKCEKVKSLGIQITNSEMISVKCLLNPDHKCVIVCHKQANKKARLKLVRTEKALKAHLAHGDKLGLCSNVNSSDEDACESEEVERKPKKYGRKHQGKHFDDKGKKCDRSDDHEHKDGPGEDRDEDDDHDEDHDHDHDHDDDHNDDHGNSRNHRSGRR